MSPDPIVDRSSDSTRRLSPLNDDFSLSLSRSSSCNEFNQFLDNLHDLDLAPPDGVVLDSSGHALQIDADLGGAGEVAGASQRQDLLGQMDLNPCHQQNTLTCNFESSQDVFGDRTSLGVAPQNADSARAQEVLEMPSLHHWNSVCRNRKATNLAHQSNQGGNISVMKEQTTPTNAVAVMPLRQWNNSQTQKGIHQNSQSRRTLHQESILQRITVGFGIGKLLQHTRQHQSISSWSELKSLCFVDNFVVEVDGSDMVRGVVMISPFVSLQITTKNLSMSSNCTGGSRGRDVVETSITSPLPTDNVSSIDSSDCDSVLCHLLGALLHYLFTGEEPGQSTYRRGLPKDERDYEEEGPLMKKKSSVFTCEDDHALVSNSIPLVPGADFSQAMSIVTNGAADARVAGMPQLNMNVPPLTQFGYPSSLSQMVVNLLQSGLGLFRPDDAYPSLDVALNDMHLLLRKPDLFLFGSPRSKGSVFTSNKLYGRSKEVEALTNAFCRVASTGRIESIFVGGYSGCGKTALVNSLVQSVTIAGGYAVTRKLDEMQSLSPLTMVLSAFNDLCIIIAQKSSKEKLAELYQNLIAAIGANFAFLTRVLPNVVDLVPSHVKLPSLNNQTNTSVNFDSLCFTIQQLMRVITSYSQPLLLFIDDLQWGCSISLKLLQSVLCDVKGRVLFIGGFRDNEIGQDDALGVFLDAISTSSDVTSSVIQLDGISVGDVNSMISDELGILPRLCRGLSDAVFRKTNGNPFFTLEFLRSLIQRDLIAFSLRDQRWKWEIKQISSQHITDNVLHLLSNKMHVLDNSAQIALKVVACFGSSLSVDIVKRLTQQYLSLHTTLDEVVVKEGFMDHDSSEYCFVHDQVREAAYSLMGQDERDQYHFDIGMALQSSLNQNEDNNSILFATINQINRCPPTMIHDSSQRIAIIKLNYEAGLKSMECSSFTSAHSYFKASVSMLPEDTWKANYDFSLKINFYLANSAYCCGYVKEAKDILEKVIENGSSLDDRSKFMLDSYSLLVSLLCLARKDLPRAFFTCLKVLSLLGEDMPRNGFFNDHEFASIVTKTKALFQQKSNEELLSMNEETTRRNAVVMQFYDQLVIVSYFAKPKLCPYFIARWARFCLTNNVSCKYTPGAFVSFSLLLSCKDLADDTRIGCRIGQIGMMILSRKDERDMLPGVYLLYYTYAGSLCEPAQAVVDMLKRAHEIGMQTGDPSKAALNLSVMTAKQINAGVNLVVVKQDIKDQLKLAVQYSQEQLRCNLLMIHEIVLRLIGDDDEENLPDEKDSPAWEETETSLQILLSFYLGHMERVYHKATLWEEQEETIIKTVPYRAIYIAFFSGLASASLYSQGKKNCQRHLSNLSRSLAVLEKARNFSEWNFRNKASLLKAVKCSITGESPEAEREFDAAILASRSSKFVHEEGLACEIAAMHHKKSGNTDIAINLFRQADSCYKAWGSQIKVRHVAGQISAIMGVGEVNMPIRSASRIKGGS